MLNYTGGSHYTAIETAQVSKAGGETAALLCPEGN